MLKTRSYVLKVLDPLAVYLIYSRAGSYKLVLISVVTVFLFVLARAVRHSTDLNEFLSGDFFESIFTASEGTETTFINAFFYFLYIDGDFPGFGENITLQRIFLFWLPALKEVDFSYIMHSAYYGSSLGDSLYMHPTVFGDAYANSGWPGAFLYAVFLGGYISYLEASCRFFLEENIFIKFLFFQLYV